MKNPLRYQISEYDCGPTSILNALSCLMEREQITPEMIKFVIGRSMDTEGADGGPGMLGTSSEALIELSGWFHSAGIRGDLPLDSCYISGEKVSTAEGSPLMEALDRGDVAVIHVFLEVGHYVLLTGKDEEHVYLFDPYFEAQYPENEDVRQVLDHPYRYNRIVSKKRLEQVETADYAMGPENSREAVVFSRIA